MIINILHAIGDIIFCEPIYRHYWKLNGEKPTVIIRDHLLWLQEYIDSAIFVGASKHPELIDDMEFRPGYLPLRFANQIVRGYAADDHHDYENMMLDKYHLAELNPEEWTNIELKFNFKKCRELMDYFKVGIFDDYILINRHSQAGDAIIEPATAGGLMQKGIHVIQMQEIPGFTLCDWALMMLYAKENHHVSTSTLFIMQVIANRLPLGTWHSKVFVYPRPNEDGLRGISKLNPTFNLIRCE